MAAALDILRNAHSQILAYERDRERRRGARKAHELKPHLEQMARHLSSWQATAVAEGSEEASPLQALAEQWRKIVNPLASPEAGAKDAGASKAPAKPSRKAAAPKALKPVADAAVLSGPLPLNLGKKPDEGAEDPGEGEQDNAGDDPAGKLLGKGHWVKGHARLVREGVPKVKAAAADPAKYLKAKLDFLKRALPLLGAYIEAPKQEHSPLFAYCCMYLSDNGESVRALEIAEQAVTLKQTSPIKRNYHELLFDIRLADLEREAPEVSKAGLGPRFDAFTALRYRLMTDPFRGNFAKAKVSKTYAQVCMALEQWESAKQNLLEVRFLNPNLGVSTLLATCEEKLK